MTWWRRVALLGAVLVVVPACSGFNSGGGFSSKYNRSQHKREFNRAYSGQHRVYQARNHPRLGRIPASDVPLVVNDKVLRWVDFWTGPARGHFTRYLQRSGRYMEMMRNALRNKGLPEDLIYIALIESGFNNTAYSRAAAVGTWQFIRSTGQAYGLAVNSWIDERRNPEKAVEAAANFFSDLYREFGDWYLAMAAYNGGPGRVRQAIARYGTTDFWDLTGPGTGTFRQETVDYVPKYIAAAIIAKDPRRFGFQVDYQEPLEYETARVHDQTDLEVVAEAAGVSLPVVQDMNPELHAGVTPPGPYELQLPVGHARRFERVIRRLPRSQLAHVGSYRVRRGDTLGTVARRHGTTPSQLLAANHLRNGRLWSGQILKIPGQRSPSYHRIIQEANRQPIEVAAATPVDPQATIHTVRRGDSLVRIARRYGVTMHELRDWNQIASNRLRVGQRLHLTSPAAPVESTATTVVAAVTPAAEAKTAAPIIQPLAQVAPTQSQRPQWHRVQRGDTLGVIAKRYGTTVAVLKHDNQLRSHQIRAGQRLRLPGAARGGATVTIAKTTTTAPQPLAVAVAPAARPSAATQAYRVRRGDALVTIARRHGVTVADLRRWNQLAGNQIRVGQRLHLSGTTAREAVAAKPADGGRYADYTLRTGDSLGTVAMKFGMTIRELQEANQLGRKTFLKAGQSLRVRPVVRPIEVAAMPVPEATPPPTAPAKNLWSDKLTLAKASIVTRQRTIVHEVQTGDTLWDLSREYKVRPEDIQEWNKMDHPALKPGQKLTIRVSS